tara:strand:- start:641 stop:1015 length:375 start_codon:yes stop_codon:yes gene_type:complete
MKNLIIFFLFFTNIVLSQSPLKDFEGIWSSPHSYWYKVFTYNEDDDVLEIYTFSFGDPSAVVEKIVKITSNYAIDTKLINHDNRWKVNITYRMLQSKKIIATYTGDINTIAELTKATLKLNHVE